MPIILEGIVTTLCDEGVLNIAPMGPIVDERRTRFVLRPFQSTTTFRNLLATRSCVFHVIDDALLLARTAVGMPVAVESQPAKQISGRILTNANHYFELRIESIDDSTERATMRARVVAEGRLRDFFGWNRAKHAVLELAILATRVHLTARDVLKAELARLRVIVEKTGGLDEHAAYDLLEQHIQRSIETHGE